MCSAAYAVTDGEIWGFKRETLLEVYKRIDTMPESIFSGNIRNRKDWGRSEAWFNQNWELISEPFKVECPSLTRRELKALAQRAWDIHMTEGKYTGDTNKLYARIHTDTPEFVSANNKNEIYRSVKKGESVNDFLSNPSHVKHMKDELNLADTLIDIASDALENLFRQKKDYNNNFEARNISEVKAETQKSLMQSSLKNTAPYIKAGLLQSLAENWEIIRNAYDNKAEWSEALSRVGTDFAGYTAMPILTDGVIASAEDKIALVSSLKNFGLGNTLGCFCWNMGREFCSYQMGSISGNEFMSRAVRAAEMIPVKVLAYIVSGTEYTLFVPVVIIGANFAFQRAHAWYEAKLWQNCIYIDDLKALLGEDLMNAFTMAEAERHYNLSEPERRSNIAEPERRYNTARPEGRKNITAP